MKIISKYKDYYDYLANMYGVDNSIVYNRKDINEPTACGFIHTKEITVKNSKQFYLNFGKSLDDTPSLWLIVLGKPYPLVDVSSDLSINPEYEIINKNTDKKYGKFYDYNSRGNKINTSLITKAGQTQDWLVELSKEIEHPVFILNRNRYSEYNIVNNISIEGRYTPLKDIKGFSAVYPVEQFYQDLSYFLGNVMKDCPDTQPAGRPELTDKDKILSHGFDLKKSFRHRKINSQKET